MTNQIIKSTAKAILLCVLLFIAGSFSSIAQTDTWVQKSDFGGTARSNAVGFSIGDKGYVGMGSDDTYSKDFWEYNPVVNTWTQKADFGGTARSRVVGFSIANKGYVGTGFDGIHKKDFWEYDPATNTWMQKADFGGGARSYAVGFSIGNKGYLGTGYYYDGNNYLYKDFWEYDPTSNIWVKKADFGGGKRRSAIGFSIGSTGYIGTGSDDENDYKDFWKYDPIANIWTQKAVFKGKARAGAIGFSIGSKGYLGTGTSYPNIYKDFWEYDFALNIWKQKADFGGIGRYSAVGFSINGKGYLGTGRTYGDTYKDFWEYDPSSVLAIRFTSFSATKQAKSILLNWQTATETNNDYFSIERSDKGNIFSAIGKVKSKGNSTAQQQYYFTDALPFISENYYRLKVIDKDGSFHYSNIVLINIANDKTITIVYPVPAKNILHIQTNGNASFSLVNQVGKILATKNVNSSGTINVSGLAAGLYYLKNNSSGVVQKVVIAR